MKPFTLRTRLTLAYTAVLASLLAALAFGYYRVFARQLDIDATSELAELTRGVRGYLRFDGNRVTLFYDRGDPGEAAFVQDAGRYLQVYETASGRLVEQSEALAPLGVRFAPGEIRGFVADPVDFDIRTQRRAIRFSNSVVTDGEGVAYLVQVGVPLDARDAALGRLLRLIAWSLPAGLVVVAAVGRWMAGGALAPIARLTRVAREIGVEDLHRRVPLRGSGDELDELASEFNGVLARLERAVGDMRQFSAAMAHEIRTPLAALRAELETSLSGTRAAGDGGDRTASQLEEVDKLTRLLGQLLTLARAEAGELAVAREPVALDTLAQSVVDTLEPVADAKGVALACDFQDAIDVAGDRGWLERLLVNLVDNAIKFTPAGGRVTVHVASDGPAAVLAVGDTGVGIPPDWLPSIFDRFWVGPTRTAEQDGAGLGLSLVKWIADQHGATIQVESQAGAGSLFTVRFAVKGATGWA